MEVTEKDKLFYNSAMEYLYNKFEIAGEFVKHDGLTSIPIEDMTTLMITSVKEWLISNDGREWLQTLNYYRADIAGDEDNCVSLGSLDLCPVCSGNFMVQNGLVCERCGKVTCGPCNAVVDNNYNIVWCEDCLREEGLTNLLNSV